MKDKRKPGQSQLDYLWATLGSYEVSNSLSDTPEETIPTQALLLDLIRNIPSSGNADIVEIVQSLPTEGKSDKIYLVESDNGYSAYVFVNNIAILIGSAKNADEDLDTKVDNIENSLTWKTYD